ncbi:MAG: PHP domain-containing protein [Motilibacteraceae bacterium]
MGHDHPHHGHEHDHSHTHGHDEGLSGTEQLPPYADLGLEEAELAPGDIARRRFLQGIGVLGATAALAGGGVAAAGAAAADEQGNQQEDHDEQRRSGRPAGDYRWLAGDHHIHTQFSPDGLYRVADQVQNAARYGLDWMVITDHGGVQHARYGVEKVNPDIVAARAAYAGRLLVFQGLEWNIPAAEHGTVFVAPSRHEVDLLKEFENTFDGTFKSSEADAVAGISWLGKQVRAGRTPAALFLANHPARRGLDSPHELRGWRDADPSVAVGMEGAPGHQAAGIPGPFGQGSARGYYDYTQQPASYVGYPPESYRTFGGFDWMTATLGGLWDSMLAEGKLWSISANSDSHRVWRDVLDVPPGSDFTNNDQYGDPVDTGALQINRGDFWPGYYSRTVVGAVSADYQAVMDGLRAGRVFVVHGDLIDGIEVTARSEGDQATLGQTLTARRGGSLEIQLRIRKRLRPNNNRQVPVLRRVDVVMGQVNGPVADRDSFTAPRTEVVKSFEIAADAPEEIVLAARLPRVEGPCFLRVRGTDGNNASSGKTGLEPGMDREGDADPWNDLWFYTNPVFVQTRR